MILFLGLSLLGAIFIIRGDCIVANHETWHDGNGMRKGDSISQSMTFLLMKNTLTHSENRSRVRNCFVSRFFYFALSITINLIVKKIWTTLRIHLGYRVMYLISFCSFFLSKG